MNATAVWIAAAVAVFLTAGIGVPRARDADQLHAAGVAMHLARRLTEASALYDQALALEPPRLANDSEQEVARRFAPRVMTTATEPFALRDVAVVLHPTSRTIAYHRLDPALAGRAAPRTSVDLFPRTVADSTASD